MTWTCRHCAHANPKAARFCGGCGTHSSATSARGRSGGEARVDLSGELLDRRFRLERKLGEGGMGEVYLARDERLGRQLAVKLLAPELVGSARAWERMWQEGQTLACIDDVNVVKVFDLFEVDMASGTRTLALAMELMPGGDLRDRLRRGPVPWREACAMVAGVLSGLSAIHKAGLVHRDIKPGNVLVAANGTPKVTDLGIARDMSGRMQTRTGQSLGTSDYMSPEQVKGEPVDERCDVYAVGLLLYELVVGQSPYADVPDYELPVAQVKQKIELRPVHAAGAGCVIGLLKRALSKDKAARFGTAEVMRRALTTALSDRRAGARRLVPRVAVEETAKLFPRPAIKRISQPKMVLPVPSVVVEAPATVLPLTAVKRIPQPKMVRIPGGRFAMGSSQHEIGGFDDERPQHSVTVSAFLMSATPVTREQYAAVMGTWPSSSNTFNDHGSLPVETVSWFDAVKYCNRLSVYEKRPPAYRGDALISAPVGYRLPTEAEWEYACRAGTTTRYWSGDDEQALARVAWYQNNSGGRTQRVAQKLANPWGLYDVHGDVAEWCHDWFARYPPGAVRDPRGPSQVGAHGQRVARGGSWRSGWPVVRSAYRLCYAPSDTVAALGFRIVRSVEE